MARSSRLQHGYFERSYQLSRRIVLEMGSTIEDHHRQRQAVRLAPNRQIANGAVERFNRFLTDQLRLARVENKPVDNAIFIAMSML